jgi:hypothetical protein
MVAHGLTKPLRKVLFRNFIEMVGLEDLEGRLELLRREDELKSVIEEMRSRENIEVTVFTYSRDLDITSDNREGHLTTGEPEALCAPGTSYP